MLEDEGYQLMGAAFEVYNVVGYGLAEEVYQQCLERELSLRGIPFDSKRSLRMFYKGDPIERLYVPDLFVFDAIVVELKATRELLPEHEAQLLNYLQISKKRVGYLVNFGAREAVEWKRFIRSSTGHVPVD
ncbi:MAG: GxxExxY protein [Planctomycetota bacterium]